MGSTSLATAITPTLYYGDELDMLHVYRYGDGSADIRAGQVVRVDSSEWALVTLLNLGVSMTEARRRIEQARIGITDQQPGIITHGIRRQEEAQAELEGRDR